MTPRPSPRLSDAPWLRFWTKVSFGDCWEFSSRSQWGYGQFGLNGKNWRAHRLAYEELVGPIPEGLVIDHLCRNPPCVNPAHLEPVTDRENALRGIGPSAQRARQTHCSQGHEFTPENTYRHPKGRVCRICARRWQSEHWYREKEKRCQAS